MNIGISFNEDFDMHPCNDFGLTSVVSMAFRKSFDLIRMALVKSVSTNDAGKSRYLENKNAHKISDLKCAKISLNMIGDFPIQNHIFWALNLIKN